MNAPFFILGNPRSGTSLFRIMLDSHPGLVVPPECGFIEFLSEKYIDWKPEYVSSFIRDVIKSRKFETWNIENQSIVTYFELNEPKSYQEACYLIYKLYSQTHSKKKIMTWGDKNNYYIKIIPKLKAIFPDAKFIHLIRDGRDVATSYLEIKNIKSDSPYKPNLPQAIDKIAEEWSINNQTIIEETHDKNYLLIKYEDLITTTRDTLAKTVEFLGVEYNDEMIEYDKKNKSLQKEPEELLAWKKKTLEKPDDSRIGKYFNFFNTEDLKKFESVAGHTLNQFGYNLTKF